MLLAGSGAFKKWGMAGSLHISGDVALEGIWGLRPFFSFASGTQDIVLLYTTVIIMLLWTFQNWGLK